MNIKVARIRKSWTQADLVSKLEVEQSYISRIDKGVIAVSCDRIYDIIHILTCKHTDIFPDPTVVDPKLSKRIID
ncbi:MAG: transcriptional regulator with XRE-family HTH domain [Gammaproteobacteria bacterium]|jgi:transcriptional regulator with XRE-family HTH domain